MKKVIKDLAVQAGFEFDKMDCNFYSPDSAQWINREVYGLSELIVKECLTVIKQAEENGVPSTEYEKIIKEHFDLNN